MIKCYRIQLESVPKVPRNFTISSYFIIENNLLKSLATKSQSLPITRENSFIITNFSFRKAPSFLECTSMLGTLTKTFRLPGLFIPAWNGVEKLLQKRLLQTRCPMQDMTVLYSSPVVLMPSMQE